MVFLNVLLFLSTACCGGFVGRTLDMSFQLRVRVAFNTILQTVWFIIAIYLQTPPLVVYYSQNPIEKIIQTEEQQASKSSETSSENKTYRGDIASE